ncbi:MAG: HAD hydrolase-like protein [bacterium]|nr:HAD hydrolase-like protein [bacterium]
MDISRYRVFIFDVNGVLFLSNEGNARALAAAFTADEAVQQRIIDLYAVMSGLDRGTKIRRVQEEVIGRPFQEGEFELRWERFRELSRDSMLMAPLGRGCREVLEHLGRVGKVRAALSNTPPAQLAEVLKRRGLDTLLDIVRGGGDWPKTQSLARMLDECGLSAADCLFLADGRGDLAAARGSGVDFAGINEVADEFEGATDILGRWSDLGAWGSEQLGIRIDS